jgi:hypothetical protein
MTTQPLGVEMVDVNEALFNTGTGKPIPLSKTTDFLCQPFDERLRREVAFDAFGLGVKVSSGWVDIV